MAFTLNLTFISIYDMIVLEWEGFYPLLKPHTEERGTVL